MQMNICLSIAMRIIIFIAASVCLRNVLGLVNKAKDLFVLLPK